MTTARTIVRTLVTWPVTSQQRARRNALVASTALAQAAHERREVEEFLQLHGSRSTSVATASPAVGAAE